MSRVTCGHVLPDEVGAPGLPHLQQRRVAALPPLLLQQLLRHLSPHGVTDPSDEGFAAGLIKSLDLVLYLVGWAVATKCI